jgi:membrane-associated phospholipid phosphatase
MSGMGGLWRWDIETFRAIHLAGRDLVADPFLQCITNMGLFHVQVMPLILVGIRPRVPWVTYLGIGIGLTISFLAEERGIPGASAYALCLILFWRVPAQAAQGAFFACAASGILRVVVEAFVNRQRPANFDFARPLEPVFGHSSFPSGHAATSMAVAVFLLWALRDKDRIYAWFALGWAVLIGLSRIVAGVHYPLDVIAGSAVALVAATAVWLLWDSSEKKVEEALDPDHSDSQ